MWTLIIILCGFAIFGIICYTVGKGIKKADYNEERLNDVLRASRTVDNARQRFKQLHDKKNV